MFSLLLKEPIFEFYLKAILHDETIDSLFRFSPVMCDTVMIRANSVDPDQTAPEGAVRSGPTLFSIPSTSFAPITQW